MTTLYWREPLWLLLALLPCLVLWLRARKRHRQTARYADPALQPWVVLHAREGILTRLFSKDSAFLAAWLLLAVAAAGPRLPLEFLGEQATPTTDLMLVVDISRSMAAIDLKPNRLRRAQIELEELLERAQGHRIGIIVYAARAHLYVPPTSDHDALRFYLASLDELTPPTQGSRPDEALALAYQALRDTPGKAAVILVTDGDFALPEKNAVKTFVRNDLPIYILGTGTVEGDAIPLPTGEWLTDDGRAVISRLDDTVLRELANATGGAYSPVRDDDDDWTTLYDNGIAKRFATTSQDLDDTHTVWRELYAWPLLPGFVLLWYALLPFRLPRGSAPTLLAPVVVFALLYPHPPAQAEETARQAYERYSQGDYAAALTAYKNLSGHAARLGEGINRYRLEDYAGAVRQFQQAMLEADTDAERGTALFNLGNSYFQLGDYAAAVVVYEDSLLYRPAHTASRHNLNFSQALQQAVEERLQRAGETSRAGSGPQRAAPSESLAVSGDASLALDDDTPPEAPLPEMPEAADAMEALIARGLAHVRLAAEASMQESTAKRRPADVALAQQQMEALQDTQALLWKRLFEMEEGFAAPLDAPRDMPGMAPW